MNGHCSDYMKNKNVYELSNPSSCKILSEVEFKRGYKGSLQVACGEKVLERERKTKWIYKYDAQNITVKFDCI